MRMDFAPALDVATMPFQGPTFSVCTLVTRNDQYERMIKSFAAHGFCRGNTEFILADNRNNNAYQASSGLNAMLAKSRGRYVICCHQDVELIGDGASQLQARLDELTQADPHWAVAGNSGMGPSGRAAHISDPYGEDQQVGQLPARVQSLDENFLVLRRDCLVGFSADLQGFHLYGTDVCLQAEVRGLTAYVIDFHLRHHSRGNADKAYYECLDRLEAKYREAFRSRRVATTFKAVYISACWWRTLTWKPKKWRRSRRLRNQQKQAES
jgi:hypothetical protein